MHPAHVNNLIRAASPSSKIGSTGLHPGALIEKKQFRIHESDTIKQNACFTNTRSRKNKKFTVGSIQVPT
jgi:hypothetical protein